VAGFLSLASQPDTNPQTQVVTTHGDLLINLAHLFSSSLAFFKWKYMISFTHNAPFSGKAHLNQTSNCMCTIAHV
jgi:hypothetical protein